MLYNYILFQCLQNSRRLNSATEAISVHAPYKKPSIVGVPDMRTRVIT